MRTTLDIEPDILQVAKELAAERRCSTGAVLSNLARAGYHAKTSKSRSLHHRNGIEMLPARNEPVSLEHIQKLMDEEGI